MAATPTRAEYERRLALVEAAIAERGWSLRLCRALAHELGVTTRTVWKYKAAVVEGYRKELTADEFATQRAEFLGKLRGHQRVALAGGRFGPLASMLGLEAKIVGLDRPEELGVDEDQSNLSREELLDRLAAELDGEMVEAIKERQEG